MRLRIHFAKTEAMRFTGHLDLHRTWERTFRRAKLPLAYSHGFHPQPRINLASALPLGFTSQAEIGDFWLESTIPLSEIMTSLNRSLPPGINLLAIEEVDNRLQNLQTQVLASEYTITLLEQTNGLYERIQSILTAERLIRKWRGKEYDLRPLIEDLRILSDDDLKHTMLAARLSTRPGATGRPEEVLAVLGIAHEKALVHRVKLYLFES